MPEERIHPGEERPTKKTLCGTLKTEANLKCLILTALIYGCVVSIIWCRITRVTKVDIDFTAFPITSTRQISPCDDGYVYIPTAFVIMLYLLYLVECWHCKARIQLSFEKTDVNTVYRKVEQMRAAQPMVWWKAVCYHYIRRTKQVTRYRNGDAYTSTQVYYERVNSHAAAGCFFYALCGMKDISKELLDLEKHAATKIRFSKGFLFANVATSTEFQEQRSLFFEEQERFDDYMEMREGLDLSNVYFKENMIAWANTDRPPWYTKSSVFWLCSCLLLSWPFRFYLELNTAHVHYQVNKLFGVNYTLAHEEPLFHQNSRVRNHNGSYRNRRFPMRSSSRANSGLPASLTSNSSTLQMSPETEPLLSGEDEDEDDEEEGGGGGKKKLAHTKTGGKSVFGCQQSYGNTNGGRLPRSVTLLMTKPERFEFFDRFQRSGSGCGDGRGGTMAPVTDSSLCFQRENNSNSVSVNFSNNYFYSYYSNHRNNFEYTGDGDEDGDGFNFSSNNGLAPSYSEALLLMEPNNRITNTSTTTPISTNTTDSITTSNSTTTSTNNMSVTSQCPNTNPVLAPAHHYQSRNSLHIADGRDNRSSHQPNQSDTLPSVQSHLLDQEHLDRNTRTTTSNMTRPRNTHTVYSANTNNSSDPFSGDGTHSSGSRRASETNGDCVNFNNFSSSRRHPQIRSSSSRSLANSSTVLDTLAPRGLTGVQIDLTQPVVVSVPRDTHRATATTTTSQTSASELPPTYEEALRTSRPVFLPALARLRRCLTERDIARGFTTNMWLNNVNPTFLQRFTVSPPGLGNGYTCNHGSAAATAFYSHSNGTVSQNQSGNKTANV